MERALFCHPGGMHTLAQLRYVRQMVGEKREPWAAAYRRLMEDVAAGMKGQPAPESEYHVPGYYRDRQGHIAGKQRLLHDSRAAYALALAYRLSANPKQAQAFGDQAVSYLMAWTECRRVTGGDGTLTMCYVGSGLLFAADLMYDCPRWQPGDRQTFLQWVRRVFLPATEIKRRENNWGDWGLLASLSARHLLDDREGFAADMALLRAHIRKAVRDDGGMPAELRRGARSLWYTYFALAPMTAACQVAWNVTGTDLLEPRSAEGSKIRQALEFLYVGVAEPDKWPVGRQKLLPRKGSGAWPYNLYEAMAAIHGHERYERLAAPRRPLVVNSHHFAWTYPTLFWSSHRLGGRGGRPDRSGRTKPRG